MHILYDNVKACSKIAHLGPWRTLLYLIVTVESLFQYVDMVSAAHGLPGVSIQALNHLRLQQIFVISCL